MVQTRLVAGNIYRVYSDKGLMGILQKIKMNPPLQLAILAAVITTNALVMSAVAYFKKDDPVPVKERCVNGYWQYLKPDGTLEKILDKTGQPKHCPGG